MKGVRNPNHSGMRLVRSDKAADANLNALFVIGHNHRNTGKGQDSACDGVDIESFKEFNIPEDIEEEKKQKNSCCVIV